MNLKDKINILFKNLDLIFKLKLGKVVEIGTKCYQTSKWITWIFNIYYFGGIVFVPLYGIWILVVEYISKNLYIIIFVTIIIYTIIEFLVTLIIPLKKTSCWKTFKY